MKKKTGVVTAWTAALLFAAAGAAQYDASGPEKCFAPWPAGMVDFGKPEQEWWSLTFRITGEHPSIAMAAADIVITLDDAEADVAAVFDFTNDGPACDVGICFPLTYGIVSLKNATPELCNPLKGTPLEANPYKFVTFGADDVDVDIDLTLDGKPVDAAFDIRGFGIEEGYLLNGVARIPAPFDAGQNRRVTCHCKTTYNPGQIFDWVEYILATAAAWKGPIGRGRLTLKPGAGAAWSAPLIYEAHALPPPRDAGNEIVWEFKDFEPITGTPGAEGAAKNFGHHNAAEYDSENYALGYDKYSNVVATIPRVAEVSGADFPAAFARRSEGIAFPPVPGSPAAVTAEALNLRTAPDAKADKVKDRPPLKKGEGIILLERRGEWFRVKAFSQPRSRPAGAQEPESAGPGDLIDAWVRWHDLDPVTGAETLYVKFVDAWL